MNKFKRVAIGLAVTGAMAFSSAASAAFYNASVDWNAIDDIAFTSRGNGTLAGENYILDATLNTPTNDAGYRVDFSIVAHSTNQLNLDLFLSEAAGVGFAWQYVNTEWRGGAGATAHGFATGRRGESGPLNTRSFEMDQIEIFKPGKHTPMKGAPLSFSEADLQASADAYDVALHEAPIVVGHPKHDAPAYGWVKDVEFADGAMSVVPDQVDAVFAEMVEAGRFKKVSASFYLPDAPGNPSPGNFYLRHVGFLGAQPPAVKGLKAISFAEEDNGVVVFGELQPWDVRNIAGLFRKLRDHLIDKYNKEDADSVIPDWQVLEIEDAARRLEDSPEEAQPLFSETHIEEDQMLTPEEIAAKEKELQEKEAGFAEREQGLSARETKLQGQETAARKTDAVAFCEGLVKEGKLLPANQEFAAEFMCALSDEDTVEFGEGDGKQTVPQLQAFQDFLSGMPNIVEFAEIAANSEDLPEEDNQNSHDIARRAVEFQESEAAAGRTISTAQAVGHVTAKAKK